MYILMKNAYADFDIMQSEVVAVSANLATLQAEAVRLNAARKKSDFKYGEWTHEYEAKTKQLKVL